MTRSGAGESDTTPGSDLPPQRGRPHAVEASEAEAAPRTREGPSHNLPLQLSSFVGRERELAEVKRLLEGTRLLTLTGPGGCGKTRLALTVANEMVQGFEDGVWLVELASLVDPKLVPQTVVSALGLREQPDRSLMDTIVDDLGESKLLLILDNCEHLVEACAHLAEATLQVCPSVQILATSREALGVAGEISWPVPSLSLPGSHPVSTEELSGSEAVRLFVERASAVLPSFGLTDQNAPAVMEVCQKLEGMPLAIELAAARVRALSVVQILGRLEQCLGLLATDRRTSVPRQRTLRATIDWSYELLSNAEQTLFRRLSVFSGGFTLETAEDVCGGGDIEQFEVLYLISQLVDKSLVYVAEQGGREARYRLLETVKQYGWERLSESGEMEEIRGRHAHFFLDLAERAEPVIMGPRQQAWVERLEQEHDNLRGALEWLREGGEIEGSLRLAGALGRFWWFRGYFSEGRAQLRNLLMLAGVASSKTAARAKALHTLGVLTYRSADYSAGDQEAASSCLEDSVRIYQKLGDESSATAVLRELGYLSAEAGDWETAHSTLEESLSLAQQWGDEHGIALTRSYLGLMAVLRGEHDAARAHLEESLGVLRRVGELPEVKVCSFYRGLLACDEGDYITARARFAETVEDAPLLQLYRYAVPWVLQGYAKLAVGEGHHRRALRLSGAADALHDALGQSVGPASKVYFRRGLEPAWRVLGEQEGRAVIEEGRAMTFEGALTHALEAPPSQRETKDASKGDQEAIEADPTGLSARELEVLTLVAEGLTDAQVAQRLYLSPRTVGHHLRRIYRKLGVNSRTAAVRVVTGRGLI